MTALVPLVEAVARRELYAHRTLSLGVVTEVFTNEGGSGDHHLDAHVRLHGDDMALQNVPVVTARIGVSAMPRVDDLVLVGFIDGDVNGAVILGVIHDADTPSPDAAPDEVVYEVPDDGGDRRAEIVLPDGNRVTVRDSEVTIAMGSTTMTIEADGDITLEAGGDLVLKAAGAVQIEAGTSATVKGTSGLTLESSASATLRGASTTISGITSFSAS